MLALNRKLLRDLRLLWSQALTIALVVASGVAGFITTLSAVDSLAAARDDFYASGHFADVFASVKRAPNALGQTLRDVPGITDVQTSIEQIVRIEVPGVSDPIVGQLIGVSLGKPMTMNQLQLRAGKPLAPADSATASIPVLVSAGFATMRHLTPGKTVGALINGKHRQLMIKGIAMSPEFIFAGLFGMPDQRGFGVFWLDQNVLAAAYNMDGAFNHVAVTLAPGASERAVIDALASRLAAYGGREAYGRKQQTSHAMLENEIKEQHVLGTVLPSIFLAVAAFLLNVVISRLVATQREQIAALKAMGYPNMRIGVHYVKMVLIIVAFGLLFGVILGDLLGKQFIGLYARVFYFPQFEHRLAPWLIVVAGGISLITAVLGTINAILATVRLAPAEAMRPPAPGHYRRTVLERLGLTKISPSVRMILRNMERRPWRTALSIAGIAAAVAIVIMGNFFRDAINYIVDSQFNVAMRNDVVLWMNEPTNEIARQEVARLPGVTATESGRDIRVRFINGHRSERSSIQGYANPSQLRRIVDVNNRAVIWPQRAGLLMTDRLANKLGISLGDLVQVEILEGRQRTLRLPLVGTVQEMMGLNAYMDRRQLNQVLGEDDLSSQFSLAIEQGQESNVLEASKRLPRIVGAFSKATLLRNMQDISARNIRIISTVLTTFAAIIAVGVVYNIARIALAERTWELASLRVLGFTLAQVSQLLLGELAISIAVALPIGMLLGLGLVHLITRLTKSDQFYFPIVISPSTYAWAGICVLAAGAISALIVRRRIDQLDMVAALKTRE
jgi:putative ABC transport system permease protein